MDFLRMQYAVNESIKIVFNRYVIFFRDIKIDDFYGKIDTDKYKSINGVF